MTHAEKRIKRVNKIKEAIIAAMDRDLMINEKKLISEFCIKNGAGHRYVKELIDDLENTGFIVRDKGRIWTAAYLKKNGREKEFLGDKYNGK